eukprot:COSAG04_NODE_2425_length_4143_cov_810.029674_6_plen_90_part_00
MLLLLLLRRLCLAPARWTILRLLAPVPRLPLQVLFLLARAVNDLRAVTGYEALAARRRPARARPTTKCERRLSRHFGGVKLLATTNCST